MTTNLASLTDLKERLGIAVAETRHDASLQRSLDAGAAVLSAWCGGRPLDSVQVTERFWGTDSEVLTLPYPIQAGTTPTVQERAAVTNAYETLGASLYEAFATFDPVSTALQRIDGNAWRRQDHPTYQVTWTTGYDDGTNEAAPTAIEHAVLDIATVLFRGRKGASQGQPDQIEEQVSPFVSSVVQQFRTKRPPRTRSFNLYRPIPHRLIGGKTNLVSE